MASKATASLAFFLALNLVFLSLVSACGDHCNPHPKPSPEFGQKCPNDAVKLAACAKVLGGLVDITLGKPPVAPCCSLIEGLADLEAAACLCTKLKANVLGINLNIPISLSLLLNVCNRHVPNGFQC